MLKTTIQFSYFSVCHVLFEFEWPDHSVAGKKGKPNVNESSSKVSLEAAIEELMDDLELEEIEEAPIETALSLCVGWFGSLSTKCTKRPTWL